MQTFTIDQRSALFKNEMDQWLAGYFIGKRKRTGNYKLYIKASVLFTLLFLSLFLLSFVTLPTYIALLLSILLGLTVPAIGFNVMHDAVHGSYSKSPWVNTLFSYSLNLLGGYWPIWKAQHNVDHHVNTNVDGLDGDIDFGKFARLHPSQPWRWGHKYQYLYLPLILYPLSYIGWIFLLDFIKAKKLNYRFTDYCAMILSKLVHVGVFIGLPLLKHSFSQVIIGYLIVTLITGVIISFVFQLAHVVGKTDMLNQPEEGRVKMDIVHQLKTTADFAQKSKFVWMYTGGLNYQVEHHLYYKISHVHYPTISKEVKKVCIKLGLPYHRYPTFMSALLSHLKKLKQLGEKPV